MMKLLKENGVHQGTISWAISKKKPHIVNLAGRPDCTGAKIPLRQKNN
jgi:hypothetical protein